MKPMKTARTLFLIGLAALLPVPTRAQLVDIRPMVVELTGSLHIFQDLPWPCDNVNDDTPVIAGRLEVAPGEVEVEVGTQRLFILTRATVDFAPFEVHRSCVGYDVTRNYSVVSVQLGSALSVLATPSSPGVYPITIPKEEVILHETSVVNGEPEIGDKHPSEDVTGTIDFATQTVSLQVVVPTKVHISPDILYGDYHGTLTTSLSGVIPAPDTDGDGWPNTRDNCRLVPNPDQTPVESPVIRAPGDLTLPTCIYRNLGRAAAADLCEGADLTISHDAPPRLHVGENLVTWTAQDVHDNTTTDTQLVTVVDTTLPVFLSVPSSLHLNTCGPADIGSAVAVDDCDVSVAVGNDAPATFPAGSTLVTWTATDDSGNSATGTQAVNVIDSVPPAASCAPVVGSPGFFRASASDGCTASPKIKLGSYLLANGERFEIIKSTTPGVSFVGYSGRYRRFSVGPGSRFITAVDAAGNSRTASCVGP
jgi:hypothetical protein